MRSSLKHYESQAKKLLAQMTLEEKALLCSGQDFWRTKGVERLGIESVMVTDGPHGLRKQAGSSDHLGINKSVPATCFPAAATSACSFDPQLIRQMGEALGEECLQEDVAVILGPGTNIKRSPLCGRNFEYFSEDPYLSGIMASALIEGVQSKGIGTSLKHYAANNQESRRMVINSVVDERAFREIYLTPFEIAVTTAQPWTVMCCYNQVNGEYGSQNKELLNDILREEWEFEGSVVTDWGAIVDRIKGLQAGLDLEMPYSGPYNDQAIIAAVNSRNLDEAVLDKTVVRILSLLLAAKENRKKDYRYNIAAHHKIAKEVAAASSVLLKNDEQMLPLKANQHLALIGEFAKAPRYQGAGSSRINPSQLDNLYDVFTERGFSFTYAQGYDINEDTPDTTLMNQAADTAKNADVAIVCIGLPDRYESEGFDRDHMNLPQSHIVLLQKVAESNSNTVVLLFGGSAVQMPWLGSSKALLMLYLGGQAGASAAADLLFGAVNPSGKLAETFPHNLKDNPSYNYFPGGDKTVEYRESIYVGYRYYDTANVDVLFPFGFGLSYTTFAYRDLVLTKEDKNVIATLLVKNTGTVTGAEVVQIYVSQNTPSVFKPVKELKGFAKVFLQPGEEKEVKITLSPRAFAYYNTNQKSWVVEKGEYVISAAASSRDIRLSATVSLDGAEPVTEKQINAYQHLSAPLFVDDKDFVLLYGQPLPAAYRQKGEAFTLHSTLGEISKTQTGAGFIAQMQQQMAGLLGDSTQEEGDQTVSLMFARMINDLPLRSLVLFSGGALKHEQLEGIVHQMNQEQLQQTE